MKRLIQVVITIIIGTIITILFINHYKVINLIKTNQKDLIEVNADDDIYNDTYLTITVESNTIYHRDIQCIKNDEFLRVYGKHNYYLQVRDSLYLLSASYNKMDIWNKTEVKLTVEASKDRTLIRWKRNHTGIKSYGIDTITLTNVAP